MTHLPPPPAGREQTALLLLTLETAVPMWAVTVASWPAGRRAREACEAAEVIAHGADVLFHAPASQPGKSGTAMRGPAASARAQAAAGDTARGYRPAEVCTAI